LRADAPGSDRAAPEACQHVSRFGAHETIHVLYEPRLLWMNEDKFVLTGFERIGTGDNAADYAQSWLCKLGDG
jgi:hypothetical protein